MRRTVAGWVVIGAFAAFGVSAGGNEKVLPAAPPAAPKAEAAPDAETAKLIAALGSENYRERKKAGEAIEAKGDRVLPQLRKGLAAADNPEVARRLTAIVRRMDHERLVSPRRVTLSMKDKTAKAVFEEIGKQTGYKIEFNGGGGFPGPGGGQGEGKFSFEFDKAPFWQAVDKVAETSGLQVYADYDDEIIRVNSYNRARNPYTCYAGPFRFVAQNINSSKSVQLSGIDPQSFQMARPQENVSISFQVHSEPKNPILGTYPAQVLVANDETGGTLIPPKDPNNVYQSGYYQQGYRGHNAYGNLNLIRGSKDATTVKTLKGKMGIILLAGVVPEIVIADPLKAKAKTAVGRNVEVNFDSMTEANGQYSVSLTVKKLGMQDQNNIDYNWSNSIWQKIEITDAAGNKYRSYGPNTVNNNGVSVQMIVPFGPDNRRGVPEKLGPPVKLVLNEWLQITHEVTFEFKNVPLP